MTAPRDPLDLPHRQHLTVSRDLLARTLLGDAQQARAGGDYANASRLIEGAWRMASSRGLRSSLSREYYDLLAEEAATEIAEICRERRLKNVVLSPFSRSPAHSAAEAQALASAVARKLRGMGSSNIVVREIQDGEADDVVKGNWQGLTPLRQNLLSEGFDAIVVGQVGEVISLLLGDLSESESVLLAFGGSLEAIQGRPDLPIWGVIDRLVPPNPASSFSVSVWTPRQEYEIGENVQVHFRAGRDCHVCLVDVRTSGGMYLLFPNKSHPDGAIRADAEYVIPAPEDGYEILAGGPSGWEGLMALATLRPMDLGRPADGTASEVVRTHQNSFVAGLGEGVDRLHLEDWAVGTWAFFVR